MKLYHSTSSPNSRHVRMFIAEKGRSIPFPSVNLGEKEQFSNCLPAGDRTPRGPPMSIAQCPNSSTWRMT
jgi:hypothetical protein